MFETCFLIYCHELSKRVSIHLFIDISIGFPTVRMLREELQLLQEQGSYVGEVVKPMDKKKVLVKVSFYFCNVIVCDWLYILLYLQQW